MPVIVPHSEDRVISIADKDRCLKFLQMRRLNYELDCARRGEKPGVTDEIAPDYGCGSGRLYVGQDGVHRFYWIMPGLLHLPWSDLDYGLLAEFEVVEKP